MNIIEQARLARTASRMTRTLSLAQRNTVLEQFAAQLTAQQEMVIAENLKDIEEARKNGLSEAMIDRLTLTPARIEGMAEGIRQIAALNDPLGKVLDERTIASGIHLKKITSAVGVIGIIFESRPNVTADCAALCLKAGSACVLKGGKESYRSCLAVVSILRKILKENGIDENSVVLAEKPSHEETQRFMECTEYVDLLIPRGGKNLIRAVVDHAKVPVIETGAGVCHVFVDASADPDMAEKIVVNAKCSRPSVCNAMETLLVHTDIAGTFVPRIAAVLNDNGVSVIYADEKARSICPSFRTAEEQNWYTEYNDLIMNLKIVDSVEEAVNHIEKYGTHHSDAIVTEDAGNAAYFLNNTDSACTYHNASTRFTDGFEFGLGAEIGISTQKLHARGPMGLNELTTYRYQLDGKGEIR